MLSFLVKDQAKRPWLSVGSVIVVAASTSLTYALSILFGLPLVCIIGLLLLSFGTIIWMAIRILKDPWSTDKTFDDYFYQDREAIRRNGKE